jgi:hypothetical protein
MSGATDAVTSDPPARTWYALGWWLILPLVAL